MWDDEINKKIKDAADQYHPAYDEDAWKKMELLLDQHLPLQMKKKRRYFWIPFVSLLVGGLFFIVYYNQTNHVTKNLKNTKTKNDVVASQLPQQEPPSTLVLSSPTTTKRTTALNSVSPSSETGVVSDDLGNSNDETPGSRPGKIQLNRPGKSDATVVVGSVEQETASENNTAEKSTKNQQQISTQENISSETETPIVGSSDHKEQIAKIKSDTPNTKEVAKAKNSKESNSKKIVTKAEKVFRNNFAIDFSAGPDVSSVGFNKTGKIAIKYGLGLSYTLSSEFTLRSGFYVAEKIYSANKSEYHVPGGGSNADYLYNIDANCKVYEIPVAVSYNFGKSKSHQWFASAGLSSYLMKKESYDYYYKYPTGNTYTKSWSISNQNQNYFSVLDLSAGYEYSFSKRTSLLAEPYLKIPLSGVGVGKVKLNSGGILFTFRVKPFYKK